MKTLLLLALSLLASAPVHAVDMTQPASVQVTVQDKDGHPPPQAAVAFGGKTILLDAAGIGRFETHSPQPAPGIFWSEHLHVTLAGFAPCDGDIRFFPGEQGDLPVILFPPPDPSKPRGERRFEPASGLPPHPMRLTLLLPDGSPAAGWQIGPNTYVASSYSIVDGIVLPPTYVYGMDKPVVADTHGMALFRQAEEHLIVLSPQGVPLLYPLHPQTWPDGLHTVTLRLPAVRRVQAGQLVLPNGKPAAGFPVSVARAMTGNEQWELTIQKPVGTLLTDADGKCTLPQYFGTTYQYESRKPPLYAYDLATPDGSVLHSYDTPDALKPSDYKEVRLSFVDENGKALPEIALNEEAYQGLKLVSSIGGTGTVDRRGVHLFLPSAADRVVITTQGRGWNPLTETLNLPGTGDQEFTVTVPQSLRLRPLGGVLLDPHGKPVPGVTIPLYHGVDLRSGNTNNDYLQFSTTTDAQGRFAFAAAPDSCEIDLYRFGSDQQPNLPGWIDPPRVTPQTRHLTLRLRPFLTGTVRVLLPLTVTTEPKQVYLESVPAKGKLPAYLSPAFDAKTHTLLWNRIPPGTYTLTAAGAKLPAAARVSQPVTLKAQGETRIDLRDKAASFPQPPKPGTISIYLTDNQGKPLSGVPVTMWTDQETWDRHFPADLTDDNGQARLPLGIGEHGVIVAHVAGKLIGYSEITGQEGTSISFPVNASQTLTVPLKPLPLVSGKPRYDSREVSLRPARMKPDEAQAVFLVLGLLDTYTGVLSDGPVPTITLRPDASGSCVAEDLPPGTYHLETGSDVTLPAD